ncbi:hypothetical protein GUITHDRAFT_105683 [Guillardia theta CCMP2712]|uniref:RWP-RK domain-containing protein n=1 Tax=Guillardia theta (strain CCMP2712) TaxID=905079 RepID=L1JJ64_GUITC|nr:hypothetical protein GUITHDRAFT_105683 [Guillardia theta CCMP2712]EKX48541.1 hypothetical protein GUITHDRAFT_105683 [Guillardia theta CCMP2712]|eukprot:XP_005835521.1 hypothetical protein GUITHDRAFT_105683 [Guillardia theta CCMP2712]
MSSAVQVNARPRNANGYITVRKVQLQESVLRPLFGIRQEDAAQYLGVSLSSLKSACRRLGIKRWPYTRSRIDSPASPMDSPTVARQDVPESSEAGESAALACSGGCTDGGHQDLNFAIEGDDDHRDEISRIDLESTLYDQRFIFSKETTVIAHDKTDATQNISEIRTDANEITEANEIQAFLWESSSHGIEATWLDWI